MGDMNKTILLASRFSKDIDIHFRIIYIENAVVEEEKDIWSDVKKITFRPQDPRGDAILFIEKSISFHKSDLHLNTIMFVIYFWDCHKQVWIEKVLYHERYF